MSRICIDNISQLRIIDQIGQGKTSEVFLAKDKFGNSFALKKFRSEYASADSEEGTSCEVKVLSELGTHNRVTKLHFFDGEHIVMELVHNGDLFDFISLGSHLFDEDLARFYFNQLIEALDFIHSSGYAHRDLKPENILLDSNFNLKIADFGFACKNSQNDPLTQIIGTEGYMAPELIRARSYDGFKVDIFAAGVMLFCMVNGFSPYYSKATATDPYYKLFVEKRTNVYWNSIQRRNSKKYSKEFMNLITGMLADCPYERFDLETIKNHPWCSLPCKLSQCEVIERMTTIRENIIHQQN